ncbi:hypothetical protein [Neobacillus cucumis]|uniref:Peptidase C39-like domain-containing protein n=1 Tax=Neobacillus cucumis TaxID=1740721 RepID=A0A2N5HVX6_9BACI|nr:hypothetical protein [Neobacillus cucumis]PLS09674.1 hypothetical protein CVD27_02230 [Neobacillus cucumis]
MSTLTGFLPSTSGFKFGNSFPQVPVKKIGFLGRQIPIGNASYGLCGGMIYAAIDYFEAKMPIPPITTAPSFGPLFEYIVNRQIDSFHLPLGLMKYMVLMNPFLPDYETSDRYVGAAPHGRAWRMMKEEWPRIKKDLDHGKLSPLGLVRVKSFNPFEIRRHHQVLAYGYDLDENQLSIFIYDPNFPNDDQVTLSLKIARHESTTLVIHSKTSEPIYSFFRTEYKFKSPVDLN